MSEVTDKKTLVKDVLISMYTEQQTMARHHEEMRSNIATIFCTLATIDFGVFGVLLQTGKRFDITLLPETLILLFLGVVGIFISRKLFEKSSLHFKYGQAYSQTVNLLVGEDLNKFINVKPHDNLAESKKEAAKSELPYLKEMVGKQGYTRNEDNEFSHSPITLKDFQPINPIPIVDSYQNERMKFFKIPLAWLDLYTLWDGIYITFIVLGVILSLLCSFSHYSVE